MSNRTLYRDPVKGKLGGVCAGLADYFGIEVWLVRLLAISALIFGGFITLILYLAAWLFLDKKPLMADLDPPTPQMKEHGWQQGATPAQALDQLGRQFSDLDRRLQRLEKWVTSDEARLARDIDRL
jgi:phage shock protein C